MGFDNFPHIISIDKGVPDGVRINDGHRAFLAASQAAAAIDADLMITMNTQGFGVFLGQMKHFVSQSAVVAGLFPIVAMIQANKHMPLIEIFFHKR
jgi:hypothetical protein